MEANISKLIPYGRRTKKKISYDVIITKYLFLLNISEQNTSEVRTSANKLRKIYKDDLDEKCENECVNFQSLL